MTKTRNQIIFFPPPKSEYFFQQHWELEYIFRKKNLQVKWSFPNLYNNVIIHTIKKIVRTVLLMNEFTEFSYSCYKGIRY